MSTVSQIGAAETAKYLMDIPSCVIPQDTDSFDSVYSDISTGDEDLDTIFEEVSKEYGVNVNLLKAVAQAESGFDSQAVSSLSLIHISCRGRRERDCAVMKTDKKTVTVLHIC